MNVKLTDKQKIKIHGSDDLYPIMREILIREDKIDLNREHFWIVGLENNNRLLFIELIGLGTVNQILVEPMEVFSFALQKRAVKIILVHNHPSGELNPSANDKDITDQMIQVGRIVNTPVEDHLIITTHSYLSFANTGLLQKLSESTKYVPPFELERRIKEQERELRNKSIKEAKEKAERKRTLDIAKTMKQKGLPDNIISELTGLTQKEVEKIKIK